MYLNKLQLKDLRLYKFLKRNNQQILRFFVSGVIASGFNFIFYRFLYLILKNILFASISGYCVGLLASFIFAKSWVFKKGKVNVRNYIMHILPLYLIAIFIAKTTSSIESVQYVALIIILINGLN